MNIKPMKIRDLEDGVEYKIIYSNLRFNMQTFKSYIMLLLQHDNEKAFECYSNKNIDKVLYRNNVIITKNGFNQFLTSEGVSIVYPKLLIKSNGEEIFNHDKVIKKIEQPS